MVQKLLGNDANAASSWSSGDGNITDSGSEGS
jgi:hypothetical protein